MIPFGEIVKQIILGSSDPAVNGIDVSNIVYNGSNLTGVNYQYGHPIEIVATISEMAKNGTLKNIRFPLIALFLDVPETVEFNSKIDNFTIIIATDTRQDFKAEDRTTETFEPILIPLYNEVIRAFDTSKFIGWDKKHVRTLRYFWGKQGLYGNEGNLFNDFIDAIEIDFKDITIFNQC